MNASAQPVAGAIRYESIVDEALVGMYVSTPAGQLVFCNSAFVRLLGFASVEGAIGTPLTALYDPPADREAFVARLQAERSLAPHRVQLRRRDGRRLDVLESAVGEFDAAGALIEIRGQLIDITETVAMERALRERERQFRAVFNDAADAILILDDERQIVEANPAATGLFGIDGPGGGRLEDLLADPPAVAKAWSELLALGEVKHEHRLAAGAYRGRLVECSYRARVQPGRHVCIARDITERRLLEERLQQAEKIEIVGRLAGGIAHDFNNLLTAMLGYTELLLANRPAGDRERADLEEIQKAGQRAAALTQQLLAFSRKQVLVPKEIDLNEALAGIRGMLARFIREDIRLAIETSRLPAIVRIDPNQFEQAVINLVLNARDAIPANGQITLTIERRPVVAADAAADPRVPPGEYIRVSVADNGIGMTPEVQAHLFEPFFTTKGLGKGSGLGLASVYGTVRQSNGYVMVDSQPGEGTTVALYLPAIAAAPGPEPPAGIAASARGATILLVEDEDAVRVIVSAVLRRNGYTVLEASTPRGACDIFAQRRSDIDLLLTDVIMPEMNGPALAQRLVAERPELKVLFISGYADVSAPFAVDNPNTAFLSKPFQASMLIERVRELLARRRPAGGAQ